MQQPPFTSSPSSTELFEAFEAFRQTPEIKALVEAQLQREHVAELKARNACLSNLNELRVQEGKALGALNKALEELRRDEDKVADKRRAVAHLAAKHTDVSRHRSHVEAELNRSHGEGAIWRAQIVLTSMRSQAAQRLNSLESSGSDVLGRDGRVVIRRTDPANAALLEPARQAVIQLDQSLVAVAQLVEISAAPAEIAAKVNAILAPFMGSGSSAKSDDAAAA
ncbi:MAG: hypothetical protein AB9M53_03610 [Leptothrix sp. (in: b-proteobacteria)]